VPDALRELLLRLHREYPGVPIMITENGLVSNETPQHDGEVHDVRRIRYLRQHVAAMADAVAAGVPLVGYTHWSLFDNFEWSLGYRPRFGLVYVDYPTGERIVKHSARHYAALVAAGGDLAAVPEDAAAESAVDSLGAFG
jgi:beta-glucosidase